MKICFVQHRAYELFRPEVQTQYGGAEVQMYLHAKELAKHKNLSVYFIVADYGQAKKERIDGVQVWASSSFKDSTWKQALDFFRVFSAVKADVYVQMTLTRFSFLMALLCRLRRQRFVYLVSHDEDISGKILPANFFIRKLSLCVFPLSSKVIAQNHYQREALLKQGIDAPIIRSSLEGEASALPRRSYHLWLARAESWKRPDVFIRLAQQFPGEKFLMICPPFVEYDAQAYRHLTELAKAQPNLEFRSSYAAFSELDGLFAEAKTFVNTSLHEGFPTTFLHAAQHGVPILSLAVDPDGLLQTEGIGFCAQEDEAMLAQQLRSLLQDATLYANTVEHCLRYFNREHRVSANTAKLLAQLGS